MPSRQVATFVVIYVINGQQELNQLLDTQSAAVTAAIAGNLVSINIAFGDFASIPRCTSADQQVFLASLASVLTNALGFTVMPSQLASSCSYNSVDVLSRKRALVVRFPRFPHSVSRSFTAAWKRSDFLLVVFNSASSCLVVLRIFLVCLFLLTHSSCPFDLQQTNQDACSTPRISVTVSW